MTSETTSIDTSLDDLLNQHFAGKVVRKDLTKLVKEGANVPVYVLEYLLGSYCASNDEAVIQDGLKTVKKILAENYVRPDEAEKVKSIDPGAGQPQDHRQGDGHAQREAGRVRGPAWQPGRRRASRSAAATSRSIEKLLVGGIWCIVTLEYFYEEGQKGSPFILEELKPIQMPNMDLEELFEGRRAFTEEQWIDVLLRSTGMEPTHFTERVKWHLLARMVPLVENNFNVCELGPRGTGKSHIYKEISPNSILISGGQTTVANLFYNMARRTVGLVGLWDVVAFDEVAGISFKDKDGVQIMKDYMASGSFARGRDADQRLRLDGLRRQHQPAGRYAGEDQPPVGPVPRDDDRLGLLRPLPRLHPRLGNPEDAARVLHEPVRPDRGLSGRMACGRCGSGPSGMRSTSIFKLGRDLNQRDTIAVKHTVSGLLKLLYPHEEYDKEAVRRCLEYALEARRRVKEQLKKIGGMEFYDVHFSYIDQETLEEKFISVPEQGGGTLIPDGPLNPGVMHTVATGSGGHLGLYRIETQVTAGNGSLKMSGLGSNTAAKEAIKVGFDYFKANASRVSASIKAGDHDYHLHVVELHNTGPTTAMTLSTFVALCSAVLGKPLQPQMVVLGSMSLGGNIVPVENLAESLQVAFDAGAKRILLPMASVRDIPTIPGELFAKFQTSFYADPTDAVFKALGVQ